MEIKITGTPEEITKMLQAIGSSQEQKLSVDSNYLANHLNLATRDIRANNEE